MKEINFSANLNHLNIDINNFPTTRYQGSKRKIIPWLYTNIKDLEFETVLDGFGGSAVVSYLFKKMGKEVTYNDNLRFNYLIGKSLIENKKVMLNEHDINYLLQLMNKDEFSLVQNYFNDIYYYPSENKWIDNRIAAIHSMNSYSPNILEYKKALAYYALFQSCLVKRPFNLFHRKNLNLRKNKVKRSFGNFRTWNKRFDLFFQKFVNEANNTVFDNGKKCYALNESIFNMAKIDYDLVYFDFPYFRKDSSNETSYYSKTYHFLEGLANYENWESWIDKNTINKRFKKEIDFDDFNSENIIDSFEQLFKKFQKSKILISYKRGGIPSINTLVKLLKNYKNTVSTYSIHYKYALNRQNGNSAQNREVILLGL